MEVYILTDINVEAIKPVFYKKWRHPGDEFECDTKATEKFKKDGKIKIAEKPTGTTPSKKK